MILLRLYTESDIPTICTGLIHTYPSLLGQLDLSFVFNFSYQITGVERQQEMNVLYNDEINLKTKKLNKYCIADVSGLHES